MKNIPFILIIVLSVVIATLGAMLHQSKIEVTRLSANQRVLLSDVEYYRTKDSLSVASVERLQLTTREFEKYCANLKLQVEELGIRVKRLQSASQTATKTYYPLYIPVRDSLRDRDTIRCIDYQNPYLDISGCMDGGTFSGQISSRDTLIQVVHRIPHRFWFIKWGTKAVRQEIVCRNPYSRIVYSEYIELR